MNCNFTLTESEVVKAMQLHGRGSKRILAFMVFVGVTLVFVGFFTEFKVLAFGSAFGGLVGFYVTQLVIVPHKAKKQYRQLRTLRSEMIVNLSEDGITLEVEFGNSQLGWTDIHTWKFGKGIYLLYITSNMFYMIPSRTVVEESALIGLLSKHVGPREV